MVLSWIKSNHNKPSVQRRGSPGNTLEHERWSMTSPLQEAASQAALHDSRGNRSCSTADLRPRRRAGLPIRRKKKAHREVAIVPQRAIYRSLSHLGSFRMGSHFWFSLKFITTSLCQNHKKY